MQVNIEQKESMALASQQYQRFLSFLRGLSPEQAESFETLSYEEKFQRFLTEQGETNKFNNLSSFNKKLQTEYEKAKEKGFLGTLDEYCIYRDFINN